MRVPLVLTLVVIGCGPVVGAAAESDTSSGGDTGDTGDVTPPGTTTSASTVGEATSVDPDPSTTVVPGDTSTSGDTSSDGDDTFVDTGCQFLCRPDGGGTPVECDTFAQDCPKGEKCMPWANDGGNTWNATTCSPVDDTPAGVGEPCIVEGSAVSGIDDCELGAMCFGVDEATNEGTCVAMCAGNPANPTCEDGSGCTLTGDGVLALCLPTCNPLEQVCPEGDGCYPVNAEFMCVPIFAEGAFGEPCDWISGCDPGLFCAPVDAVPGCAGDLGCCSSFCDFSEMNASDTCPGVAQGQQCVRWYEDGQAPPGLEDVGACVIP